MINAPRSSADEAPHATSLARRLRTFQSILSVSTAVLAGFVIAFAGIELSSFDVPMLVRESVTALQAGTHVPFLGLVALALLALCGQIVDMTNWQRVAAFAKDRDAKATEPNPWSKAFRKFAVGYAIETPFAWLFMCAFGAVIAASIEVTDGADVVQSFVALLTAQENSFADTVLVMLFVGILAMALSTMIALFSAMLCTLRYDLLPGLRPRQRGAAAEANATRHALTAGGALCLVISHRSLSFRGRPRDHADQQRLSRAGDRTRMRRARFRAAGARPLPLRPARRARRRFRAARVGARDSRCGRGGGRRCGAHLLCNRPGTLVVGSSAGLPRDGRGAVRARATAARKGRGLRSADSRKAPRRNLTASRPTA